MAKITLGAAPKTFSKEITVAMLDGSLGTVNVEFKYRSRIEFAAFLDSMESTETDANTAEQAAEQLCAANAKYLFNVVVKWDLSDDLTLDSLKTLCSEYPAVADEIMRTYRTAIVEGRIKN